MNRTDRRSMAMTPASNAGSRADAASGPTRRSVSMVGSAARAVSNSADRVADGKAPIRASTSAPRDAGIGRRSPGRTTGSDGRERPGDLERVERVAAGRLLDPDEHEARERSAEPGHEELMQGGERHRPEPHRIPRLVRDAGGELQRRGGRIAAHGQQDPRGPVGEAPDGVRQDRARGIVDPLRVVERDDEPRLARKLLEQRRGRHRQRPLVRKLTGRLGPQDRDVQGVALDRGERRHPIGADLRQEVREPAEGQLALGFGGCRAEDDRAALLRPVDRGSPDRGLADPGLTVDDQAGRAVPEPLDETIDGCQLDLTSDDLGWDPDRAHADTLRPATGSHGPPCQAPPSRSEARQHELGQREVLAVDRVLLRLEVDDRHDDLVALRLDRQSRRRSASP